MPGHWRCRVCGWTVEMVGPMGWALLLFVVRVSLVGCGHPFAPVLVGSLLCLHMRAWRQ